MDAGDVMSIFLRGVLGSGGRKRARRAARFVSGHRGFLSASTVLAAAGLAWGVYDSLKGNANAAGAPAAAGPVPPPLPTTPTPAAPGTPEAEVLRLVRLAVSAARADGTLAPEERAMILEHARQAGLEQVVEAELAHPQPLAWIAAGVEDERRRRDLYVLAFTIVRADESVNGAERIYLAQLANQLRIPPEEAARLERETAATIDATPADGEAEGEPSRS